MVDAKSRAKVQRLLSDDFRPGDLSDLFIFARDHCDGRQTVTDIGDFVAHHNERDRGIITNSTREWFATVRYHMSVFSGGQPVPLDRAKMPTATKQYFKVAANRLDAKLIRDKTGLRRAIAYERLGKIADRLIENGDGTWALPNDLTNAEAKLIECVSSVLVVKPAFLADRLIEDFIVTLKSNGLITKEEAKSNNEFLRTIVQLFAVAAMHNCIVQIGDGTTTKLKARPESPAKHINVNAAVPNPREPKIFLATSMFTADLDPALHCSTDLQRSDWDFEIEVAPNKLLSRLG